LDKKRASDWLYLVASAAISYYLIAKERGDDKHMDIVVAHNIRKALRYVRVWLIHVDSHLQDYIDDRLDKERSV
jgi:hypothetical protein